MSETTERDVLVVGGGLVGSAIAYGLVRQGLSVAIVDEGDLAFRAARANFGLVWVQGKGDGMRAYTTWTLRSVAAWPTFAKELQETTGLDVAYTKPGGIHPCLTEKEMEERQALIGRLKQLAGADGYECELMDGTRLRKILPHLGERVIGGSYSPYDGHTNPLRLLRALHADLEMKGVAHLSGRHIDKIERRAGAFVAETGQERLVSSKVVLAAGLDNRRLAEPLGLRAPVRPSRGQIMVTERVERFLPMPVLTIRQTDEGTVIMGDSHEDVGLDTGTTVDVMAEIASRSAAIIPALAKLKIVRAWAGLRILNPDGFPVYEHSTMCPGAYVATCHSGVTLAAVHASALAAWIAKGETVPGFDSFSARRFNA